MRSERREGSKATHKKQSRHGTHENVKNSCIGKIKIHGQCAAIFHYLPLHTRSNDISQYIAQTFSRAELNHLKWKLRITQFTPSIQSVMLIKKMEHVDTHSVLFCLLASLLLPRDTKSVLLAVPEYTGMCIHRAPDSTKSYCPLYFTRCLSYLTYRCAA